MARAFPRYRSINFGMVYNGTISMTCRIVGLIRAAGLKGMRTFTGFGVCRRFQSFREIRLYPLLELLTRDLGTPGPWDFHQPLHVFVGAAGFDQFLHTRKKHILEELAHLVRDLLVERLGSDGRLFLFLGGFLLGLEFVVVFFADT